MRTAEHYRRLIEKNPDVLVDRRSATCAVYAAQYGQYTPGDAWSAKWKAIYHCLDRYGDTLSAEEVLAEMQRAEALKKAEELAKKILPTGTI